MKKSIIAMAVAGALAVPAIASADATLYGHVMMAVDKESDSKLEIGAQGNSESRIGLRGTADTGIDGLTAIYNIEFGVNTNQTAYGDDSANALRTRLANAGLTGDFGTVLLGSQWTPHWSWVTSKTDVMLSSAFSTVRPTDGDIFRVSDSAAYVSPNFGGFQVAAAVVANGADNTKTTDVHHVAAKYDNGGLGLAISYVDFTNTDADAWAFSAGYDFGVATVAMTYAENTNAADNTVKPFELAATYKVTDATTLKGVYADHRNSQKGYAVEVQHDLSNMVNTFVGYGYANSDLRDAGTDKVLSTGLRVRF